MLAYFNRQGYYSMSFNSCMYNGTFSFSMAKQLIDAGQPLALFLDVYSIASITEQDNNDYISYYIGDGCHVMAGFGYKEITYRLTNGTMRTDEYVAVASGIGVRKRGYFNINYSTQIDEAYGINVI